MKEKLLSELRKKTIPNFEVFKTKEAFEVLPQLLGELLQTERDKFITLVEKENTTLVFEDFVEFSELDYLRRILNHIDSCYLLPELRDIISNFRPKLEDLINEESYSKPYYEKLLWLREYYDLSQQQRRIIDLRIKKYEQRGIALDEASQERLKELNKQYSQYSEKFQHNVIDDQSSFSYHIDDESAVQEVPKSSLEKAKRLAGEQGGYAIDADPTLLGDFLKCCSNQQIRKEIYSYQQSWASSGTFDNRPIALKLLALADEKAKILGYHNAAESFLWDTMAESPKTVFDFITPISKKALAKMDEEIAMLKETFNLEKIEPYDIAYYSRKYKEIYYNLDEKKLKEYFEFEHVLSWLHRFVKDFFGVELHQIDSGGEEKWYEVYKDGEHIAYFVLDAFYRKGKRPGAWADILREKLPSALPIIFNVANIQKNENGQTLIYLSSIHTLFHEFGHALHAMLSASPYAYLNGFNIERDFVELPSQLMENRVDEKESLGLIAQHYKTGERMPEEILDKLEKLRTFMQGYWVSRQNELALVDNYLYTHEVPEDISILDKNILDTVNTYSYFKRGEEYKMYCAFLHIFGGGYEAKYYSYMWAETYAADLFSKIKEAGMFNKEIGLAYRDIVLAAGSEKAAKEIFRDFMGREVSLDALMKQYGLDGE